ncbi:glycosyltransferase family 4 protein [Thiorhodococcus fuscus]|uniref:Glycosyltransferase family 4 protein n=1 Tax=Thiorhodococcus fuscus TaxID=527200 RepID=A0ABW4YBH0_9GAMM
MKSMPAAPSSARLNATSCAAPAEARNPRLLWANAFCLLDTSSGASISVREMLRQLAARGWEIEILGATIFDDEEGVSQLRPHWDSINNSDLTLVNVADGLLRHRLVRTASTKRAHMTSSEEVAWLVQYIHLLDTMKPDLVWFYGGQTLDLLIPYEARIRGIPSAAYLANGNYRGVRWCHDVDLVITDSDATARFYAEREGFGAVPVGKFIDPDRFVSKDRNPEYITFVNPSLTKGAAIVAMLALSLEKRRPDIRFEVVQSRGDWAAVVRQVSAHFGGERESLDNVMVTSNTSDMRPVYARAKILLAPSLWWESAGRVLVEAMLNGIPVIITDHGGGPEMIGDAGIKVKLPQKCYEKPYAHVPSPETLKPLLASIEQLFDDDEAYRVLVERAYRVGRELHSLEASTNRLLSAFEPLVGRRSGDCDHARSLEQSHKHGLSRSVGATG